MSTGRLAKRHGILLQQRVSHRRRLDLHLLARLRLQAACLRAGNRQTTPKAASHITSTVPLELQAGRHHSDLPENLPGINKTIRQRSSSKTLVELEVLFVSTCWQFVVSSLALIHVASISKVAC